jgi:hypothetical protein
MIVDKKTKTFYWKGSSSDTAKRYYTYKEILEKRDVLLEAQNRWQKAADVIYEKNGGEAMGSCVLGDHIKAYVLMKGCRKPRLVTIVHAPAYQDCSIKEESSIKVLKWLKEVHGIECRQASGRMD